MYTVDSFGVVDLPQAGFGLKLEIFVLLSAPLCFEYADE